MRRARKATDVWQRDPAAAARFVEDGRRRARARLPLSVPETLPPPVTIEIEALEPDEAATPSAVPLAGPPTGPDEAPLEPRRKIGRAHVALLSALPVVVGLALWLLMRS